MLFSCCKTNCLAVLEERCQLLGTEEESSDRHSSASESEQDDT